MEKKSVFGPFIVEKVAFIVTFFKAMSSLYPVYDEYQLTRIHTSCFLGCKNMIIIGNHYVRASLVKNSKTNGPWHFFFTWCKEEHLVVIVYKRRICNHDSCRDIQILKNSLTFNSYNIPKITIFALHRSITPKPIDHDISPPHEIQRCIFWLFSVNGESVTSAVLELLTFKIFYSAPAQTILPIIFGAP